MTPKEQMIYTAQGASMLSWNKHINRRMPNPGDYIKSLPEDVRSLLKDLKSDDVGSLAAINIRPSMLPIEQIEEGPWGRVRPLWTIPSRESE